MLLVKDADTHPAYKRHFTRALDAVLDPRSPVSYWDSRRLRAMLESLGRVCIPTSARCSSVSPCPFYLPRRGEMAASGRAEMAPVARRQSKFSWPLLLGVLGTVIAIVLAWRSRQWPLIHVPAQMHYLAWLFTQGEVPYRDVFDITLGIQKTGYEIFVPRSASGQHGRVMSSRASR